MAEAPIFDLRTIGLVRKVRNEPDVVLEDAATTFPQNLDRSLAEGTRFRMGHAHIDFNRTSDASGKTCHRYIRPSTGEFVTLDFIVGHFCTMSFRIVQSFTILCCSAVR